MGHGAHTPVSIYLFFHFFNFFHIDKMFFFLIIASFIATIDCKSSLAKGPLGPSPSLKTKSIFKSPGMQGGLNRWNGPEDHRQADEQKNVLKAPVESDCKKARAEAKIKRSNGGWMFHIPSCLSDGTYDPTQCHSLTSMCWCVKADGTVIEETYVFLTPLDCEEFKDGLPWWWDYPY